MFKLDLEKAKGPEIKLTTSVGSLKKQESSRKTSTSLLIMSKPLAAWITTNSRKFFKKIREHFMKCFKGTFHEKLGSIKDRNGMDLR